MLLITLHGSLQWSVPPLLNLAWILFIGIFWAGDSNAIVQSLVIIIVVPDIASIFNIVMPFNCKQLILY